MTGFLLVYLFIAAAWWPVFAYHWSTEHDLPEAVCASVVGLYCAAFWPVSIPIWAMAAWVVRMKGGIR